MSILPPAKLTVLSVPGLASWASYLVNDDASGLAFEGGEEAVAAADKWFADLCAEHPFAMSVFVVDCSEDSRMVRFNGLLSDVVDYTIHVHTPHSVTLTLEVETVQLALRALLLVESEYNRLADKERPLSDTAWQNRMQASAFDAARNAIIAALPKIKG